MINKETAFDLIAFAIATCKDVYKDGINVSFDTIRDYILSFSLPIDDRDELLNIFKSVVHE